MKSNTKKMMLIGVLSALSFILYFFEIPVGFLFPLTPFLKIDLSDVPVILTAFTFSPGVPVAIAVIKNILHLMFLSKEPLASGEIANLLTCITFILPIILIKKDDKVHNFLKMSLSTVLMTIVMVFINYFITLPLYGISKDGRWVMMLTSFIPFNFIKGVFLSLVTIALLPTFKVTVKNLV